MDQLWKQYCETGVIPIIGEAMGRPTKPVTADESRVIDEAYRRFRYGARMLEKIIRKFYAVIISHNRIHRYLMDRGLAKGEASKRKQRKWVRYERTHSMSAGHFGAHRRDENGHWDSQFKQYLETKGISPILARVKHPQTNDKLEKWFHAYKRFRYEFASLNEFIVWHNNRPHGSLDFDILESPELAFWRRLPQEAILGIGIKVFGW